MTKKLTRVRERDNNRTHRRERKDVREHIKSDVYTQGKEKNRVTIEIIKKNEKNKQ